MLSKKALMTCLMLSLSTANAAVVTINYSGTINGASGLASDLQSLIPIGQTFNGSYTYDTTTPGTVNSIGDISYLGAISNFTVNFGSLYATLDNGAFRYQNDKEVPPLPPETESTFYDTYIVQGRTDASSLPTNVDTNIVLSDYVSETLVSGYNLRWLRLDVTDVTSNMLTDALLTGTPPDISALNMRFEFGYILDCCTGRTDIYGTVDSLSISSVPIPPAIWLFVSGIASLISFAKYKNRQNS